MSDPDDTSPSARPQRDSLLLLAELHGEDGGPIGRVRVRNLSATGLMADCEQPLSPGLRIRLSMRAVGDIGATVSWWRDGRIGLAFDNTIDPQDARRPMTSAQDTIAAPYALPRYSAARRKSN